MLHKHSSEQSLFNNNEAKTKSNHNSEFELNDLTNSLSQIYDSISLYEFDSCEENGKKFNMSWETWYLNKKIQSIKNKKKSEKKAKQSSNEKRTVKYTEEEKKQYLIEWLEKKKIQKVKQQKNLENNKASSNTRKNSIERKKAEENYQNWLTELKERERAEKIKKQEEYQKSLDELERQRKLREEKKQKEINKKNIVHVRPNTEKKGTAIINGKLHSFYDWSTSPNPSFFNKNEFLF